MFRLYEKGLRLRILGKRVFETCSYMTPNRDSMGILYSTTSSDSRTGGLKPAGRSRARRFRVWGLGFRGIIYIYIYM